MSKFFTYEDTSQIGLGPTLTTSFEHNYLFKIWPHSEVFGVRASAYEFWREDIFQPVAVTQCE